MAELAVVTTLGVLQIVVPLLRDRYKGDAKAKPTIEDMRTSLEHAMAFIKDQQDCEGGTNNQLENSIKEVQKIAQDIEDVLDEFLLHSPNYPSHNHRFSRKAHNIAHQIKNRLPHLWSIPNKMGGIGRQLEYIAKLREAFPQSSSGASSSTPGPRHRVSPLLLDHEMVGYEDEKRDFIAMLENRVGHLVWITVVGHAGSGKTTFVRNVFWDRKIRSQFHCMAWIHLGRRFASSELLPNLLKQLCPSENLNPLDPQAQLKFLCTYLSYRNYLVVLDDVWPDVWGEINWNALFPDGVNNRVIVTTRSSDVAPSVDTTHKRTFELNGLKWHHGWELFCRKAFSDNKECPAELEGFSSAIVQRCEGIPLYIVAAGCTLARKPKLPNKWAEYHKHLDVRSLQVIHDALLPDYMELSSYQKCCFLYYGIFPEDYSVSCQRLIRLWVAEGFVAGDTTDKAPEDVAEDYLNELISRHLVDVTKLDFAGRPRNCRVRHNVLKFIIQKCEYENFVAIFNEESTRKSQRIRRLSLHHDHPVPFPAFDLHGIRSIFLTKLLETPDADFNDNLRKMKMLKVFDFQAAPLTEFPQGITDLKLLKYLSFQGTQITKIPSCIKKFSYLETLDLKQTDVKKLPKEVSHLHNLRHLIAYKYSVRSYITLASVDGVQMHHEIGKLTKLQHLSVIKVDEKGKILEELKKIRNLRKLGVMELRVAHGEAFCAAVEEMKNIRTLDVSALTKDEFLKLAMTNDRAPWTLERLYLKGRLETFPSWISLLLNLQKIALKWSKLRNSPVEPHALGNLPHLVELQLVDCYDGELLEFKASTFKMLKLLVIEELERVDTIKIEKNAMVNLTELSLRRCGGLKICPLGLENLEVLEKLDLYDMADELIGRIRESGVDHYMVAHIPKVCQFTLDHGRGMFIIC